MGRGRKPRAVVAKAVEDGPAETIVGENKENKEAPAEQGDQLLAASQTVNVAMKSECKNLGSVRRSPRLQTPAAVATPPPAEPLIRDIMVVEGEEEEDGKEPPQQERAAIIMSLKERCDRLEQMFLESKKTLEELISLKGIKWAFSDETTSEGEMSYKNLYFESQKKVKELMEEKQQLFMKLEKAHGQIEIYEKLSNTMMSPSVENTNEPVLNETNEATHSPYVSQDTGNGKNAKRKEEA